MLERSGLNLSTLTCKAGASLDIDPVPRREVTVISGTVQIGHGSHRIVLGEGEHALLDPRATSRLSNCTDEPAELLVMTRSAGMALRECLSPVPAAAAPRQVRFAPGAVGLADQDLPRAHPA